MNFRQMVFKTTWVWLACMSATWASGIGDAANEFWVDRPFETYVGPSPSFPDVAVDYRGRQIYVWDASTLAPGLQAHNIVLRVFDAQGQSLLGPVQINTYETQSQLLPRVAIAADGSFLVIWQSFEPPNPGDNFNRIIIRGQAFDSAAAAVGGERVYSDLSTLKATGVNADVTALRGGGYVAVWGSGQSLDTDDNASIQGRRIGATGAALADQFQVNTTNSSTPVGFSTITDLADGGFFAAWVNPEIRGRRFQADGTPTGDDFQVNTLAVGRESEADLATNQDGRVLLVWNDNEAGAADGNEIRGRVFSANLVPQGNDFRINSNIAGIQQLPSVGDYEENGFFVVWQSDVSTNNDNEPHGIEGRIVTGNEAFSSAQFQVNTWVGKSQTRPSVGGKSGQVATVWSSQNNSESTSIVVQGRSWSVCGIYCDGFED